MKSFLSNVAEQFMAYHKNISHKCCIIFPNQRAGLFFKKELSRLSETPLFSPKITTLNNFIFDLSNYKKADNIDLVFKLYHEFLKVNKGDDIDFSSFISLAQQIINDFNEIDLYLADASKVFSHLSDLKMMGQWSPNTESTELQKKYLSFFESLDQIYQLFVENLIKDQIAYPGLAYKKVAESMQEILSEDLKYEKYIFIGFSALSNSEVKILNAFKKRGVAEFYWDADDYYLNDENQEAGFLIKKHIENFGNSLEIKDNDNLIKSKKEINIYGISGDVAQIKYASTILEQDFDNNKNNEETALILADESLLIPALYSIPKQIENINVTMGYPIKTTVIYTFFRYLFTANINYYKFSSKNKDYFHLNDISNILNNPCVNYLVKNKEQTAISNLNIELHKMNRVFLTYDEIEEEIKSLDIDKKSAYKLLLCFNKWENKATKAIKVLDEILDAINANIIIEEAEEFSQANIDKEVVFLMKKAINKLYPHFEKEKDFIVEIRPLLHFFDSIIAKSSINFYGEPLAGLQILGVLETRLLDFKHIIITSMNDGKLPAVRNNMSFLTFDIRYAHDLPLYKEKESVFAYHFYRMIQRCEKVDLIYNSETGGVGKRSGGDKSRFIAQLEHEAKGKNSNISINHKIIEIGNLDNKKDKSIRIKKDDNILKIMEEHISSSFSQSAIFTYLRCPLAYYYSYVLKLKKQNELEEEIQANTLGTIIHNILMHLYLPFLDNNLKKDHYKLFYTQIEDIANKELESKFSTNQLSTGKNLLIKKLIIDSVKRFLKNEENKFINARPAKNIKVLAAEEDYKLPIEKTIHNKKTKITFQGVIDRVEQIDNLIRIADYKTGNVDESKTFFNIEEVSEIVDFHDRSRNKDKIFQLLFYAYIYSRKNDVTDFECGIYSTKNARRNLIKQTIGKSKSKSSIFTLDIIDEIEDSLVEIITDILDREQDIVQTDNLENCKFCEFKDICN